MATHGGPHGSADLAEAPGGWDTRSRTVRAAAAALQSLLLNSLRWGWKWSLPGRRGRQQSLCHLLQFQSSLSRWKGLQQADATGDHGCDRQGWRRTVSLPSGTLTCSLWLRTKWGSLQGGVRGSRAGRSWGLKETTNPYLFNLMGQDSTMLVRPPNTYTLYHSHPQSQRQPAELLPAGGERGQANNICQSAL